MNPYAIPENFEELLNWFEIQFKEQHIPASVDCKEEARKFYDRMTAWSRNGKWYNKKPGAEGAQAIKLWQSWTKFHISKLKEHSKGSYKAPTETIYINDCCWRTEDECDCVKYTKNSDSVSLMSALESENPGETAAFELLIKLRRAHAIVVAKDCDDAWLKSNITDFAENYMEDMADKYFQRMAPWIEFFMLSEKEENFSKLQTTMTESFKRFCNCSFFNYDRDRFEFIKNEWAFRQAQ